MKKRPYQKYDIDYEKLDLIVKDFMSKKTIERRAWSHQEEIELIVNSGALPEDLENKIMYQFISKIATTEFESLKNDEGHAATYIVKEKMPNGEEVQLRYPEQMVFEKHNRLGSAMQLRLVPLEAERKELQYMWRKGVEKFGTVKMKQYQLPLWVIGKSS